METSLWPAVPRDILTAHPTVLSSYLTRSSPMLRKTLIVPVLLLTVWSGAGIGPALTNPDPTRRSPWLRRSREGRLARGAAARYRCEARMR